MLSMLRLIWSKYSLTVTRRFYSLFSLSHPNGFCCDAFLLLRQECAHIFETLQTDYYEEYKTMGLADLAVAVIHPLLKEKLRSWDPVKVCFRSYPTMDPHCLL